MTELRRIDASQVADHHVVVWLEGSEADPSRYITYPAAVPAGERRLLASDKDAIGMALYAARRDAGIVADIEVVIVDRRM